MIRIFLLGLSLLFISPVTSWGDALPQTIGSLRLQRLQSGGDARREIDQMHGTRLNYRKGYIGTYGEGKKRAKLWVSEYESKKKATGELEKMVLKMRGGKQKSFWHFQEIFIDSVKVYFVVGMGQTHYFYRKGEKVIWLAIDPDQAREAIRDVLQKIP